MLSTDHATIPNLRQPAAMAAPSSFSPALQRRACGVGRWVLLQQREGRQGVREGARTLCAPPCPQEVAGSILPGQRWVSLAL